LKLAVELVRRLNLHFAVAANRDGIGKRDAEKYCRAQEIDVAFRLPDERCIVEAYSSGRMIVGCGRWFVLQPKLSGQPLRCCLMTDYLDNTIENRS
jgi:MinD superfamily P-loop ATPase